MQLLGSALVLTIYFVVYGVVHSWLASAPVKTRTRQILGPSTEQWYRPAYNIFAVITLLPMLILMRRLPDKSLYSVPSPWRWLMIGAQLAALAAAGLTVLQTGVLHFMGLAQLFAAKPTEFPPLNFRGFYTWVRHPLYTFSLVFLWLTPAMTINSFTTYLLFTLYFIFGSEYEERRMVNEYGQPYEKYRQSVPRLIPNPGRRYVPQANVEN